jgi:hypothetical protein
LVVAYRNFVEDVIGNAHPGVMDAYDDLRRAALWADTVTAPPRQYGGHYDDDEVKEGGLEFGRIDEHRPDSGSMSPCSETMPPEH